MKTSRLLLRLFLPLSLGACSLSHGAHHHHDVDTTLDQNPSASEDGGATPVVSVESDAGTTTPIAEPNQGSDLLWHFARKGDQLALVGIDLAAGTLDPRQFTLPFGFNDVKYAEAWATDIVRFELNDGSQVLMGQGDTWTEFVRAVPGEWLNVLINDDSSLAWVVVGTNDANGSPSVSALAIEHTVTDVGVGGDLRTAQTLYQWQAAARGDLVPAFKAFAAFGVLFMLDREVFLVSPSNMPPSGLFTAQDTNAAVLATFAHSFILADKYPAAHWLGEHGEPLSVPGFAGDLSHLRGAYQLDGTKLSALDDGKVAYVQDVGAFGETDELWGVRRQAGPLALIRRGGGGYQFVGDHGAVLASYQAFPNAKTESCMFGTLSDDVANIELSSLERDHVYLTAVVNHDCYSGDSIESLGQSLDILALDRKTGEHSVTRALDTADYLPSYQLTESGDYLGGVVDGHISRVPTHDGPPSTLTFEGVVFLDWIVHQRGSGS